MTIKVGDNDVSSKPTVNVPSYPDMKIAFHDPDVGSGDYPQANVRIEKLWVKTFEFTQ